MTFHRGAFGLGNYAVVYGVDAVVWLEGGERQLTLEDVSEGRCNVEAEDVRYWQTVFARFLPGRTLRFRAVGSKGTLLDIAKELQRCACASAFVAMDRDADALRGDLFEDKGRVFHTWGYSWENDLAAPAIVAKAVLSMCPVGYQEHRATVEAEMAKHTDEFIHSARRYVVADSLLNVATNEGLFDRKRYSQYIAGSGDVRLQPRFAAKDLRVRLHDKNRKYRHLRPRQSPRYRIHPPRDCLGHLVARLIYCEFKHLAKNVGMSSEPLSFDIVTGLLTGALDQMWEDPAMATLHDFHASQFA